MKKKNVLTIAVLLMVALFNVKAADMNILYAPSEWYLQPGMIVEWEDEATGVMAFEVETGGSHDAWVAAIVTLNNVDVDKYPKIVVNTTGLTGGDWNMKISNPLETTDNCYSFFSNSKDGGDQSAIGEHKFNLSDPLPEGYKLSGETSFKIWIWVIGKGERLLVSELYLEELNGMSVKNILDSEAIVSRAGGITINNANNGDIFIYTIDGKLVKSFNEAGSTLDVDLEKGVYIVNAGGKSTKAVVF